MRSLRVCLFAAIATCLLPQTTSAGSFVAADATSPDLRAHRDYFGAGGELPPIRVCVDISLDSELAIQAEPAVRNVVATYNRFRSLADNTFATGLDTSAPADKPDFETVLLHEFMHANGLGHPQHAGDPAGAPSGPYPYQATRSTGGPNGVLNHLGDPDGLPGSADDQRGDDDNLNWYVRGVNDPGALPAVVDDTTMARTLDGLPSGHAFAANGNAAVMAALGYANSESAAHQGHVAGQVQRHLHHEDMAMLRLARAGLDGIAGTEDDYRAVAIYAGRYHDPQGSECSVVVRFDDNNGAISFASTLVGLTPLAPDHFRMIYPTRMRFNPAVDWYFTPGANTVMAITAHTPMPGADLAPVSVQASVTKAAWNTMSGDPRGTVIVRDGPRDAASTATCSIDLAVGAGGVGDCLLTPLVAGHKTLTADYIGWGGWDGNTASITHDVTGTVEFSAITHTPQPSAVNVDVTFAWTLAPPAGAGAAQATGEVVVKESADCASPPGNPAHQCSATLPDATCTLRFASSGPHTMQLCYGGDSAIAPASATVTHDVLPPIATQTTLLPHMPTQTAPFEAYTVQVQVREQPDQGGHPQGIVIVRDGPESDALTSRCSATLTGTPGETASCVLSSNRAGPRTLEASYAAQGLWAASSAQGAAHVVRSFAIASHLPATSRAGQAVSVVVALDVRPFAGTPAPTGTIVVGDGIDTCEIVLPASTCLWRGSTPGARTLTATWSGDANYAGGTTAAVTQTVEASASPFPLWVTEPLYGHAESNAASTGVAQALSADGRFVVFSSVATNLVAGDSNNVEDVFVHDQLSGAVRRVSVTADGTQGNGASRFPSISADGRYVSFQSAASNFFPGDGSDLDVFVKDLHEGGLVRASTLANGGAPTTAELSQAMHSSLSADGRYVAFSSYRTLAPGDVNGRIDIYVKDLRSGAVDLVSSNAADQPGDGSSLFPAISADGRHVAFISTAGNLVSGFTAHSLLNKVFVKDRTTRDIRLASATAIGEAANRGCGDVPSISADGRYVAFQCNSSNLPQIGAWDGERVFVKDMATGAVEIVSGQGSNSRAPAISGDGRYVVFQQGVPGYVGVFVRDRQTGTLVNHHVSPTGDPAREETVGWEPRLRPAISLDGRFITLQSVSGRLVARDLNAAADVFVRDRTAGVTRRASAAHAGVRNDGDAGMAAVSSDGSEVLFVSSGSGLIHDDGNARFDVFHQRRDTMQNTRLSAAADGTPANGDSFNPAYAEDAGEVVFLSSANNLVPNDSNGKVDVFVKRLDDGSIARVNGPFGLQSQVDAQAPLSISRDGGIVLYTLADGSRYAGTGGNGLGIPGVMYMQRDTSSPVLISRNRATGQSGNAASMHGTMSDDASVMAFASDATNLGVDNGSAVRDVFVHSRALGQITHLASSDAAGVPGNGASEQPALSPDGRFIAFVSDATNLVPGDSNGVRDVFVKRIDSGAIERVNTTSADAQGTGGGCSSPSIGAGARYVGFVCAQANLVPGGDGLMHYYVKDRATGAIVRVSQIGSGVAANADSRATAKALSDAGTAVFESNASNLGGPDMTTLSNVFLGVYSNEPLAASTTTIVSVSPATPSPGAPYTVTVEVSGDGSMQPGGEVRVSDGAFATPCNATLTPGNPSTGSCVLTTSSSGAYVLAAYYGGDFHHRSSSAPGYPQAIPDPQPPAKPIISNVTPGNRSATVEFYPGGNIGSPFLDYTATCGGVSVTRTASPITVASLTNGVVTACTVHVRNNVGNSPPSDPVDVTPRAPTTTSITAHQPDPSLIDTAYTVSISVLGDGAPLPSGSVTVSDGAAACSATLTPGTPSTGSCALTPTTRGSKTLAASYAGDVANVGSSGNAVHTVASLPGAPTLSTVASGAGRATLTFAAPTDDGGMPIIDYRATCGTQSVVGTASPILVTGLANGVEVGCHVTARSAMGTGAASNAMTVVPRAPPSAPTLTEVVGGDRSATLHFTPPTDDGASPITEYRAQCGAASTLGPASPLTVTGLANGSPSICRVFARNAVGQGAGSNMLAVTPATVPDPPALVDAQAGDASAIVTFDAPTVTGGSAILDYTATCGTQTVTGTSSPLTVASLVNGVEVSCHVAARNAVGTGAASNAMTVTPMTVPDAPLLTGVVGGDQRATLTFDAPSDDGGSAIVDYTASCGTQTSIGTSSPLTVIGLDNGIEVSCHVTARNAAGTSAASNTMTATPMAVPGAPVLVGAAGGDERATLTFDAPSDNGGSAIVDYTATCGAQTTTGTSSPLLVTNLANGIDVVCHVTARNAVGSSAASNGITVSPARVPDAPVLTDVLPGDTSATVQFDAPGNDGGRPVTAYVATCGSASAQGSASPIVVGGLSNDVAVACRVVARNAIGDSAPSNAMTVTPEADVVAPDAPTLTAALSGNASVTLQFDPPGGDGGAPIIDYTATCGSTSLVGNASPIVVAPLTNGVAVSCAVTARNAAGASAPSNALSATPATLPGAPTLTSASALPTGVRLTFTAPLDDGGSAVIDYEASCSPGPALAVGAASPITVSNLTPQQVYRCRVRARNGVGSGPFSDEASAIPGQGGAIADLSITKSNGVDFVNDAVFVPYLITVYNAGPADVVGARVEDALAPSFAQADWTCDADASAWCPAAGTGALDIRVDMPANTTVRILFSALPAEAGIATPISNIASVTPPDGIDDPLLDNNVVIDGPDKRGVFRDGLEARVGIDADHASGTDD